LVSFGSSKLSIDINFDVLFPAPISPSNETSDTLYCVDDVLGTFVRDPPLLNQFDRRACLGMGAFGTLVRAKRLPGVNADGEKDDALYAVKCIDMLRVGGSTRNNDQADTLNRVAAEAQVLQSLNHRSIVQYVTSCHDAANNTFYIVMEFVDGVTLSKKIQCNPVPSEFEVFTWMQQIASALAYLHDDMHIIHRDLKPSNVLVSDVDNNIKLCDFGLACEASAGAGDGTTNRRVGTRNYFNYEKIAGLSYENGCDDMWAVGCILVELLAQQRLACPLQQHEHWSGSDPNWFAEGVTAYRKDMLQLAAEVSPFLGGEILPGLLHLCPERGGGEEAEEQEQG
jgi:serine/threonine protein kinase